MLVLHFYGGLLGNPGNDWLKMGDSMGDNKSLLSKLLRKNTYLGYGS
jgi:hypothetical protein